MSSEAVASSSKASSVASKLEKLKQLHQRRVSGELLLHVFSIRILLPRIYIFKFIDF